MRIVIDNSAYAMRNMGDIAMLQICVRRLRAAWPDAKICVVTNSPDRLARFTGTTPVPATCVSSFYSSPLLPVKYSWLPGPARRAIGRCEQAVRSSSPKIAVGMMRMRQCISRSGSNTLAGLIDFIKQTHLFVVSGGGFITDVFAGHAANVLDAVLLAQNLGIPTAAFGQGLGPLADAALLHRLKRAAPRMLALGLRESRAGVPVLASLGISENAFRCTGDDAIELAYESRPQKLGSGLGVNVRVADYSHVGRSDLESVWTVIQHLSREFRSDLVPIPIDVSNVNGDMKTLRVVCDARSFACKANEDSLTPTDSIRLSGLCRVVITGSYHAAVFALSQGIPAVGLAKSPYYLDKFFGLRQQFGDGCEVVDLNGFDATAALLDKAVECWKSAEELRPGLLEAAKVQVAQGRAYYLYVAEAMSRHQRPASRKRGFEATDSELQTLDRSVPAGRRW